MNAETVIIYLMAVFAMVGALDRIFGNRFGFGAEFERGFHALGPLALTMVGVYCASPVIADFFSFAVSPLFSRFGVDPSVICALILPIDSGAYPVTRAVTDNLQLADFSTFLVGATFPTILILSIPLGLSYIKKGDEQVFALGVLSSIIAVPVACLLGGLIMGIPFVTLLVNLAPILILAALIALGLLFAPRAMMRIFQVFAWVLAALFTFFIAATVLKELTGLELMRGLAPMDEVFVLMGKIAVVLAGAYPLVHFLRLTLRRPLTAFGRAIGVNEVTVAALIASCANGIPMLEMLKDMNPKGKMLAFAFVGCGGFLIGDHLAFASSMAKDMIMPMFATKIFGGVFAMVLACLFYRKVCGAQEKVLAE